MQPLQLSLLSQLPPGTRDPHVLNASPCSWAELFCIQLVQRKVMSQFVNHAWQRVQAAYSTVPPALDPTAWLYIGTFAALAVPIGMFTGVLNFKVEKRPSKWLEVGHCCSARATATGGGGEAEFADVEQAL